LLGGTGVSPETIMPFRTPRSEFRIHFQIVPPQPRRALMRPGQELVRLPGVRTQAQAVLAMLVDVQFKRYAGGAEGFSEHQAVLHGHGLVVRRGPDEAGRRVGGDVLLGEISSASPGPGSAEQVLFEP